jgi:hypothetical protein
VSSAAVVALPGLSSFVNGECGNEQSDCWVEPPQSEEGVGEQAEKRGGGEVGAEQVLAAFALGGVGVNAGADASLRDAERWHDDQAGDGQADTEPTGAGLVLVDQRVDCVAGDIGGEEEKGDGDGLLRALFGFSERVRLPVNRQMMITLAPR